VQPGAPAELAHPKRLLVAKRPQQRCGTPHRLDGALTVVALVLHDMKQSQDYATNATTAGDVRQAMRGAPKGHPAG
jgi:hypothetical protein